MHGEVDATIEQRLMNLLGEESLAADLGEPPILDAVPPPHSPGTYPFTVPEFQPDSAGPGYSGNYRAFALTGDSLRLYMPDQPMTKEIPTPPGQRVWSMDGGTVVANIPLASLAGQLKPQYGG